MLQDLGIRIKQVREEDLIKLKDYAALGNILMVDAIIIGKITELGVSNMPIYERGNVSFHAECIDTKNGNTLWSMEINESTTYVDEIELADKVIEKVLEKLKKELE